MSSKTQRAAIGDRTCAVERHVVEKARLTRGPRKFRPQGLAQFFASRRDIVCAHLPDFEIGLERCRRGTVSIEGRIAGAPDAGQSALLQPAARHVHVWAGAEPDEEALHAFGRKQPDETPDATRIHPCFGAAQIDAIEVGGCKGSLTAGIDGDVTIAEGCAVEFSADQAIRPASRIQPGGKPPHFQRQADLVHCAPREHRLRAHPSQFSRKRLDWEAPPFQEGPGTGPTGVASSASISSRDRRRSFGPAKSSKSPRWPENEVGVRRCQ